MKDEFYVMRAEEQLEGLQDMIYWINSIRPTDKLRIIEIGSYTGESTLIFAKHFKEVISVDPYINDYDINDMACSYASFDKVYQQFLKNTLSIQNVKSIRDTSQNAISVLKEEKWDVVYIDGIHTFEGVLSDIENYKTIIKPEGFICGHDYGWDNVRRAIENSLNVVDCVFKDGSWVKRL
jgi:predicted O-methyltransferase YrrM